MWKYRTLGPDSWGIYQRNDFSESRPLHLFHRKAPNSLTWNTWFLHLTILFGCSWLPDLCCKTPILYVLAPPLASLEVFQNYLNAVPWAAVLILPKENLTPHSHIVQIFFFFFGQGLLRGSQKKQPVETVFELSFHLTPALLERNWNPCLLPQFSGSTSPGSGCQ